VTDASPRPVGRALTVVALVLAGAAGAGCRDDGPGAGDPGIEAVVATFEVSNGERFAVELDTPELVDHAERLLAGENISAIPLGTVVRGDAGVNDPWTWHLDPGDFEFAFATVEVCDGLPSDVERGVITSDQFCPWSARVVEVGAVSLRRSRRAARNRSRRLSISRPARQAVAVGSSGRRRFMSTRTPGPIVVDSVIFFM
jgi:hypothetical protein